MSLYDSTTATTAPTSTPNPKRLVHHAYYEIDKGIPLAPVRRAHRIRPIWRRLEVGDSFLFPADLPTRKARVAASNYGRLLGRKFATRTTRAGVRCWRVA
jgi:hypothetical protein